MNLGEKHVSLLHGSANWQSKKCYRTVPRSEVPIIKAIKTILIDACNKEIYKKSFFSGIVSFLAGRHRYKIIDV